MQSNEIGEKSKRQMSKGLLEQPPGLSCVWKKLLEDEETMEGRDQMGDVNFRDLI